jgi:hypothetical protein
MGNRHIDTLTAHDAEIRLCTSEKIMDENGCKLISKKKQYLFRNTCLSVC